MELNETTADTVTITGGSKTTITVPNGEVWKITNVVSEQPSTVGVYDGSSYWMMYSAEKHISVGSVSAENAAENGARVLVVDGDKHDFAIENNGSDNTFHWSATRVA